jgi:hypothetical protein
MNEDVIITAWVVIDAVMGKLGPKSHGLASVSDSEVLLISVVAALYFRNHQERALCVMLGMGYVTGPLSVRTCKSISPQVGPIVAKGG